MVQKRGNYACKKIVAMTSKGFFLLHQKVASVRSQQSSRGKMGSSASSEPSFRSCGSSSVSFGSLDGCSRDCSNSCKTRGTEGSTYYGPNPTKPNAIPEVDEEIVQESVVYLEGWHRFVDHKTCSGRIIRTEKDSFGRVHWSYEPYMSRLLFTVTRKHRSTYYPSGQGPTIRALKKYSEFYHGHYNLFSNNCGTYAEAQVSGWPWGQEVRH